MSQSFPDMTEQLLTDMILPPPPPPLTDRTDLETAIVGFFFFVTCLTKTVLLKPFLWCWTCL